MFVDTHMHEMTCSKDSFLKLEEMVEIAREKGLGAICITDHDDMGLNSFLCRETLLHLELKNIRMREFPRRTLLIW